jgi:hypothetical protein
MMYRRMGPFIEGYGAWLAGRGTPSILVPAPCGFGISTARTGGGNQVPEGSRFQILYRLSFRSDPDSVIVTASRWVRPY